MGLTAGISGMQGLGQAGLADPSGGMGISAPPFQMAARALGKRRSKSKKHGRRKAVHA